MEQKNTRLRNVGFITFFFSGICAISSGVVVSLLQEQYGFAYGMTGTLLSLMSIGNLLAGFLIAMLPGKLGMKPNTWPAEEYHRRGEELERFVAAAHPLVVTVVEDRYDPQEFYSAVAGLENEPERGGRCTVCYRLRMRRAAQYAAEHGFDWFTTTLSISPHKDAKRINAIGQELEQEFGVRHLPSDFKKQNGYLRSLQLSEEYGLYRQDYCGCEFSAKARGIGTTAGE